MSVTHSFISFFVVVVVVVVQTNRVQTQTLAVQVTMDPDVERVSKTQIVAILLM